MKHLFFAALIALVALVGCTDKKGLPFDPYTQIALNAAAPKSKITPATPPYAIDTILRYATYWSCHSKVTPTGINEHGIGKEHRDFVAKRLFVGGNHEVVDIDNQGNPKLGHLLADSI